MTFNYESIYVSDCSKAGFSEVDYGFGPPTFAGPLVNNDVITSVVNSSSSPNFLCFNHFFEKISQICP